jgi:hypothetical protein
LWVSYQISRIIKKSLSNWLTHAFNTSQFNHTPLYLVLVESFLLQCMANFTNKMIILIFSQIGTNDTRHTYIHTHPHIHIKHIQSFSFIHTHKVNVSHIVIWIYVFLYPTHTQSHITYTHIDTTMHTYGYTNMHKQIVTSTHTLINYLH